MKMMKWDTALAAQAQRWANNCKFGHSPGNQRPGAGENVYYSSQSGTSIDGNSLGKNKIRSSPNFYFLIGFSQANN